jgi:N-acetylglucosaminyldiphosphoundecaprenol N-acetyl-beta-D-mannosaminyltransferase
MTRCVSILGVRIDVVTLHEARDAVLAMAQGTTQHHIMTPNPEMLVAAHRDPAFKTLLNTSALNIPDGAGLLWAAPLLTERVTGVDLLSSVCASLNCPSVFLLGAADGVAAKAADVLRSKNPSLTIAGTFSGSPREEESAAIISRINTSGAHILFVAYGAPIQDFWIEKYLSQMPGVKVAMGVGGSLDFLAGVRVRAPALFRQCGLEWLWRLVQEPSRFRRILNAVIVFPFLVLTHRQSPSA